MAKIRNLDNGSVREVKTIDVEKLNSLIKQRDQYKTERDTLIDDLSWYKAKVSRLERENDDLKHENKALRIQSNTYFDEWQEAEKQRSEFVELFNKDDELLSEISQHIGNKPSSSTYKYFRAKLDGVGIKEGEDYGV
ncbi:hypothetical protein [Mammaliicoccus vitulinus]|uniref:hypothetical protein n=1 Tax=Mammaliicoccus vitulinus TaxID=71237 RepID=UPI00248AD915|nr:hypothetical protein [Mammaliicoccus vitulinus]